MRRSRLFLYKFSCDENKFYKDGISNWYHTLDKKRVSKLVKSLYDLKQAQKQ